MNGWLHVCLRTYIADVPRSQKRALDPLELELQMSGNHHVDAGNRFRVPLKSS